MNKLQSTFEIVHVELTRWLSDAEHANTSANQQPSSPQGPCCSSNVVWDANYTMLFLSSQIHKLTITFAEFSSRPMLTLQKLMCP